jgi:hypothetical protein
VWKDGICELNLCSYSERIYFEYIQYIHSEVQKSCLLYRYCTQIKLVEIKRLSIYPAFYQLQLFKEEKSQVQKNNIGHLIYFCPFKNVDILKIIFL